MKNNETLTLIEGLFETEEAGQLLRNIYMTKIHFHEMRNFSHQERFGKEDSNALSRIKELKRNLEKALQFLQQADGQKKMTVITSEIQLSMMDKHSSTDLLKSIEK